MLDDFMVRAALAGIGVAFASAPLGCFGHCQKKTG
jgi:zinc transport system permease protein